jgi:hypothetical protein
VPLLLALSLSGCATTWQPAVAPAKPPPPAAEDEAASSSQNSSSGGAGAFSSEPLIYVAARCDTARGALRSMLGDAAVELQRDQAPGSPGPVAFLQQGWGSGGGSSALGPFARAAAAARDALSTEVD